jgi:hypothetical protein
LVNPVIVVVSAGGLTVSGGCAVLPTKGVTVYEVIGLPPSAGADQLKVANPLPGFAITPVGAPGTLGPDVAAVRNTIVLISQ